MKRFACVLLLLTLCACVAPQEIQQVHSTQSPLLQTDELITSDGQHLALRSWLPKKAPSAVIIALHGMNDYSRAFEIPGLYLSRHGFAVYAYDQRSFGKSSVPGLWPGEQKLVRDLKDMITVIKQRYPHAPVFVLGESMGGAVAIAAFSQGNLQGIEGIILSAPAVWGGDSMNPFYRATLWTMAQIMPDKILTGRDLHILASDNIPMLIELGRDPLVQKGTRVDSVIGLVRLMDTGYANIQKLQIPVFVLYGKNDQVIPPAAMSGALTEIHDNMTFAYYPQGYHMLLRDLHNREVLDDIVAWIDKKSAALPSGNVSVGRAWLTKETSTHKNQHYPPHNRAIFIK